jgi:L-alanine-DL-glutamate epimerase-like enolase superfamily enzyme
MKITDVRVTQVTVPFAKFGKFAPVSMWYMTRHSNYGTCVTFIDTDEGITGVSTQNVIGTAGTPDVIMNQIRPLLIGQDPFNIEKIEMDKRIGGGGVTVPKFGTKTVAAIDIALWDIIGKACNKPLYKLWGGKIHDPIHVRYWLCDLPPKEQAAEALKAVEAGFKSFKIKLGHDPKIDVECAKAVREAVGDDVELNFDINGGYPLSCAMRTLPKIVKVAEPASIEEPIPNSWPWDQASLEGMAELRKIVGVPIEAHSHGPNVEEFVRLLIEKRAADAFHTKPGFSGGILQCKRLCAMAGMGGIKVTGQSSAAELGPNNAAILHWITSTREFTGTNDSSTHLLEPPSWDIIKNEFRIINSTLKVPKGPGLGVEIDPEKLKKSEKLWEEKKYPHEPGLGRTNTYLWG